MQRSADLTQVHARLRPLIAYARRQGWAVIVHPDGSLLLRKRGLPAIYTVALTTAGNALSPGARHG